MLQRYRTAYVLFIAAALLLAVPILFGNSFNWWQRDLLYAIPVVLAIWAQILYFNIKLNKLESTWQLKLPKITLPEYMVDDLEDIKEGRITGTQFALLTTTAGMVIYSLCLLAYNKFTADWYGFNVVLISLAASTCVAFLIARTEWFSDQTFRTPMQIFLIPLAALVFCVGIGIYMTEPLEIGGPSAYQAGQNQTQEYNYDNTRAHSTVGYYWGGSSSRSSSVGAGSGFKCNGKGCGYAVLVIILVILVLVLMICSALVAHFWVMAGMLLLTIMLMIAIHELRVMNIARRRLGRSW